MYPNQYGQQPPNPGFNSNFGQQQGGPPQYPPNQGGLPYPVQPSGGSGFTQNAPPYPQAPGGGYAPQLPGSGGGLGYPNQQHQPQSYPQAPPAGYPPTNQPGGYPPTNQPGGYPPSGGYNPNPAGAYPPVPGQQAVGAYPPTNPTSGGYSPYPATGQGAGYPPTQPQGYPPQSHGQSGYPQPHGQQPSAYLPHSQGSIQSSAYPQTNAQPAYPTPAYGSSGAQPHQPSAYPSQPYTGSQAHSYGTAPHGASQGFPGAGGAQKMQAYVERPTVIGGHFDPAGDAQALRKAMKGFGTDETAILNVICKRTNAQRLQISQAFKTSFGKDLIKDLKSELGGRFEEVIIALMTPRFDYLAMTLHKAISGIGTKERSLVDILCTATNEEIRLITAAYTRLFGRSVERDLMGDTSGHFRRLLVSITCAGRMESQPADPQMAASDAKALYDAGANKIGTDEATFNQILCLRSFPHLRLVFHDYERTYGRSFEKVIENEFSGDIESGLKAVVASAKNRAAYFATRLHESFAGVGTKDDDLVFIMVTRCEIDMQNIKDEYQRNYNKTLSSAIASETSGDYKKALVSLLGE